LRYGSSGGGWTLGTSYEKLFCVANVVRRSAPAAIAAASRGLIGGGMAALRPEPGLPVAVNAASRGERLLASDATRCSGDGRRSASTCCCGGGDRRQLGSSTPAAA